MRASVVVAIVIAGLSAATSAQAATGWSAPQAFSRPHEAFFLTTAGYTATGTTVASWAWFDEAPKSRDGLSMASRPASHARFGAERALPADVVAGPSPYGAGRVIIATQVDRSRHPPLHLSSTLSVRFGDLRGHFGRPQVISRHHRYVNGVRLAVNGRGDAVLAFSEEDEHGRLGLYVSLRRPGQPFGPARRMDEREVLSFSVAVGPAGDVLVAWDGGRQIRARFKARSDGGFGPVDSLRSKRIFGAVLATAVTASGRAWVAWRSQLRTEGGTTGDADIQIARRPAGARHFDRALLLDHAPSPDSPSLVSLAAGDDGAAVAAWSFTHGGDPSLTVVRAAHVSATGVASVTPLASYASDDGGQPSAAYADDGDATVTWQQSTPAPPRTTRGHVSLRPAAGTWGAPQLVTASPSLVPLVATYAPGSAALTLLGVGAAASGHDSTLQATTRTGP